MTLKQKTFSAIRWTTFSSLIRAALQFVQIIILARLLTPADFGMVAIVFGIMGFIQYFADAGVSNAIIHQQDITANQLSSLYWLNVVASFSLFLILAFSSYWIAEWYQKPAIRFLLIITGGSLLVGAMSQQLRIVAQKNLNFSTLTKVDLLSALAGFIAAVSAAVLGAGVYSLVVGGVINTAVASILAWLWLADGWRPSLRLKLDEIRGFLKFGLYIIGNNLANMFNSQVDIFIGGNFLNSQALGFYSLPKELNLRVSSVINPIVTQVGLPVMAKAQNDEALLRRVYLQTMRMTASVNFPIYLAMGIFAPEIVNIFLGSKWLQAIPMMQLFACWALLRSTGNPVGSLLLAKGRADLSFKWNVIWLCIIPPVIWVASHFGAQGMAMSLIGLGVVGFLPNWYFLVRPLCGAGLGEYSVQMGVPLSLAIVAGLGGIIGVSPFTSDFARLFVGIVIGGGLYLLLSWRFNNTWIASVKGLVSDRGKASSTSDVRL